MPEDIIPRGDDQPWKKAVDKELKALRREIEKLRNQLKASS